MSNSELQARQDAWIDRFRSTRTPDVFAGVIIRNAAEAGKSRRIPSSDTELAKIDAARSGVILKTNF
jgi:hypothetical protein